MVGGCFGGGPSSPKVFPAYIIPPLPLALLKALMLEGRWNQICSKLCYIPNYFLTGLTAPPPPSKEVWVWVAMMEDFFEDRGVPGAAAAVSTAAAAPAAIVA